MSIFNVWIGLFYLIKLDKSCWLVCYLDVYIQRLIRYRNRRVRFESCEIVGSNIFNPNKSTITIRPHLNLYGIIRFVITINLKVDGYDRANNTVYEFHGCFWHGHPCHHNADLKKSSKTLERDKAIKAAGYDLVTMTSCEWIKNVRKGGIERYYMKIKEELCKELSKEVKQ